MSEPAKLFTGAKALGKRVPKAAWYVAGGVVIAGGVMYYRNRDDAAYQEAPGDSSGAVGYTDASGAGVPGVIVAPQSEGIAVPSEINTDIPTTTLGIFGDLIGGLMDRIPTVDELALLAGAGSPQQGAEPAGVVTADPPGTPTATKPKPNPCAQLGDGFNCGDTVTDGNLSRKFSGAIGWKRDSAGGSGKDHWIKYRIRYCGKLEIWQVYPNRSGNPWSKTHGQTASNIC